MPKLLSGSTLRRGGSGEFIDLAGAQPQLPANADTSTGYTIVTNSLLQTSYRNSLGNIEFYKGEAYSNLPDGIITLAGTGTGFVLVKKFVESTSTYTGSLVVEGGVGVGGGLHTADDIVVNGLTIGRGYEGWNNIVINSPIAEIPDNDLQSGQQSISIGWGSLQGIDSSNRVVAIGRETINTGTQVRETIAIGDRALQNSGILPSTYIKNINNATQANPIVITTNEVHNLSTGMAVIIENIVGMSQLNSNLYYVDALSTNTVALYSDINLSNEVDGTVYNPYVSDGIIYKKLLREHNIAIGTSAGRSLVDGQKNVFIGDNIAVNLTQGNSNFFLGHDVANNILTGSANISLMCDNLVSGEDNQIGIGSIFYYNGKQLLRLETNANVGIGTLSTDTNSGAFVVEGGLGVNFNANIGGVTKLWANIPSDTFSTGTLVVVGGAGISGNLNINGQLNVLGPEAVNLSPSGADVVIQPTLGGTVTILPNTVGSMDNVIIGANQQEDAYFVDAYADNFIGLATTSTNLDGGDTGSLPYQLNTGTTAMLPIGLAGQILTSNGTTIEWTDNTASTTTDTYSIFVEAVDPSTSYNLVLGEIINDFSPLNSTSSFTYNTIDNTLDVPSINVTSITSATSTDSGALQVVGGVGVQGSIYSSEGGEYEGNLLYTPRVTVSNSVPTTPRVGDFWIDTNSAITFQFIQDGLNRIWIQFSSL